MLTIECKKQKKAITNNDCYECFESKMKDKFMTRPQCKNNNVVCQTQLDVPLDETEKEKGRRIRAEKKKIREEKKAIRMAKKAEKIEKKLARERKKEAKYHMNLLKAKKKVSKKKTIKKKTVNKKKSANNIDVSKIKSYDEKKKLLLAGIKKCFKKDFKKDKVVKNGQTVKLEFKTMKDNAIGVPGIRTNIINGKEKYSFGEYLGEVFLKRICTYIEKYSNLK